MPLVSIVVACCNSEDWLEETIASIKSQDYSDWEAILINDGSTDSTCSIIQAICQHDFRFSAVNQENLGLPAARNAGIRKARGEFILPLDSDDLISASYLSEAVPILLNDSHVKVVYCLAELFGDRHGPWNLPEFEFKDFLLSNCIFCSALFRKSDFHAMGGYDCGLTDGYEDWDLWIRLLASDRERAVHRIEKTHFFYRIRHKSMTRKLEANRKRIEELHHKLYLKHADLYFREFGALQFVYRSSFKEIRRREIRESELIAEINSIKSCLQLAEERVCAAHTLEKSLKEDVASLKRQIHGLMHILKSYSLAITRLRIFMSRFLVESLTHVKLIKQ